MNNNLNQNIKRIRKEKGYTQEQLADAVGISAQAVSKWESGSFPDAALLPDIADFFGVTIDELFGRSESVPIQQQALDYLKSFDDDKKFYEAFHFFHIGCLMFNQDSGYWRFGDSFSWETYSQTTQDNGFIQARLNKELQYLLIMPEPEKGYDDLLCYDEKYVKLFAFLAEPYALKAMYFLYSCKSTMFFNADTLVKELGIDKKTAQNILDKMEEFKFIWKADFNSGEDTKGIYQYLGCPSFTSFMTFSYILLNRPDSFQCHMGMRNKPFFSNKTYKNSENQPTEKDKKRLYK